MKARAYAALFSLFALIGCVFSALQPPTPIHTSQVLVEQVVRDGKSHGTIATVKLEGSITPESADRVVSALANLPPDLRVVVFVIDSPGGDLAAARRIVRSLEELPALACVVDGDALSAAFYLLQSCPARLMTLRSTLMVHEGRLVMPEGMEPTEEDKIAMEAWNRGLAEQVCGRLAISREDCVARYASEDWWMGWREGLSVGAVDDVVQSPREVAVGLSQVIDRE